MLQIKRPRDFAAAALFILIGIAGLWFGRTYQYGSAARMGPGYFPMLVSGLLILLGLVVAVQSIMLTEGAKLTGINWRAVALIVLSIVAFGFLVEYAGLVIAIVAVVGISAFATTEATWKAAAILAVSLAIFCVAVFVYALKQPLMIFPGG
jgi:hypothetical protein